MSTSTPSLYLQHRDAVYHAEARRLARTLTSYGALTRGQLHELSGARRWSRGRFLQALNQAVDEGLIRHLGFGFYAPAREDSSAEGSGGEH